MRSTAVLLVFAFGCGITATHHDDCLHVHRVNRRWFYERKGEHYSKISDAVEDYPESERLARRGEREQAALYGLLPTLMLSWIGIFLLASSASEQAGGDSLIAPGAVLIGVGVTGFGVLVGVGAAGDVDRNRAVRVYNEHARVNGCK